MASASPYQSASKVTRPGVVRGVSLRYGGSSERPPPHRPEPPHRGPRRRFDGPRRSTPACRSRLADRARLCGRRDGFRHLPVGGRLATTAHRRGRRIRPRAPPPRARGSPKRRKLGHHAEPPRTRPAPGRARRWCQRVTDTAPPHDLHQIPRQKRISNEQSTRRARHPAWSAPGSVDTVDR